MKDQKVLDVLRELLPIKEFLFKNDFNLILIKVQEGMSQKLVEEKRNYSKRTL